MVWASGAEVQMKSLALVRKRFAPVRTGLAPQRKTCSELPHRRPKPPFALNDSTSLGDLTPLCARWVAIKEGFWGRFWGRVLRRGLAMVYRKKGF